MSKPAVTYPDSEEATVADLKTFDALDAYTAGVGMPKGWTPGSPIHLHVACDGQFLNAHPFAARSTMRVTAWGGTPTATKRAAQLAMGCLLSIGHYSPLVGVLPATDDETNAELASFTVRRWARSTPI